MAAIAGERRERSPPDRAVRCSRRTQLESRGPCVQPTSRDLAGRAAQEARALSSVVRGPDGRTRSSDPHRAPARCRGHLSAQPSRTAPGERSGLPRAPRQRSVAHSPPASPPMSKQVAEAPAVLRSPSAPEQPPAAPRAVGSEAGSEPAPGQVQVLEPEAPGAAPERFAAAGASRDRRTSRPRRREHRGARTALCARLRPTDRVAPRDRPRRRERRALRRGLRGASATPCSRPASRSSP